MLDVFFVSSLCAHSLLSFAITCRSDVQVLPGSTSEHVYGVLIKQLECLDLPLWGDVMADTK